MHPTGRRPIMGSVKDVSSSAHRIADELKSGWLEQWIDSGIEDIEAYLAKHAAFLAFLDGESQLAA
jgi:hypothetical protein